MSHARSNDMQLRRRVTLSTLRETANLRSAISQIEEIIVENNRLLDERRRLLSEKDVLAEELQHRVRNNLQLVFGMLNQQIDVHGDTADGSIAIIARRVIVLATIYDQLLGKGLSRTIDFDRYLRSLCASLHELRAAQDLEVTLSCDGEPTPLPLDVDSVTVLGIVLVEIVSNAYIHGFPDGKGEIHVGLAPCNVSASLTIGDNGVGFVDPPSSKRRGLGLVRRLMEQIGGTASVVSDCGTKWTLIFPISVSGIFSDPA